MPAGRRTYLRWIAIAGVALAAELLVALVAIAVAGRSPSVIVASSPSPSPTSLPIPHSPSPVSNQTARPWAAAAFYPPSGKVVFFGGVSEFSSIDGPHASNEMWTWDGAKWLQLHPVNLPPARWSAGL